jgi:hypothetical protein
MSKEKIFFQTAGSKVLAELTRTPYPAEAVLQKALADAEQTVPRASNGDRRVAI